jgi:hypothetical protein
MSHSGKNKYIIRHVIVCTHPHCSICKKLGIETAQDWCSHIPNPVTDRENITVLWNQGIQTNKDFWQTGLI